MEVVRFLHVIRGLERAFATINRHAIWVALKSVGVPEQIITIIRELYLDADCSELFKDAKSSKFRIDRRVRQGCVFRLFVVLDTYIHTYLAQTPEIGQGLGRFLSCRARKQEQT